MGRLAPHVVGEDPVGPGNGIARALHFARPLQVPHQTEGRRDVPVANEEAVIAQDQHVLVAQAFDEPGLLVGAHADAFEIVVRHAAEQHRAVEIVMPEAALFQRDRDPRRGVRVHDAMRVFAHRMDRAVDDEPGLVHRMRRRIHRRALQPDLDQVGGRDLAVIEAERVDEVMALRAGHAQGDVVVDELSPAHEIEDPVAGGELNAQAPFLLGHALRPLAQDGFVHVH